MEAFSAYGHALVSIVGSALIALLIGPFAAMAKAKEGLVPGAGPAPDYANKTYRMWRAHINATEIFGTFAGVTFAAILAGASPFWVNLFASLFFVSRIAYSAVYVTGIGKPDFGQRTICFVFGWAMCACLALMTVGAVFW